MLYVYYIAVVYLFFFFKQKTAYEMRISDWSSDVCSSDLRLIDASETMKEIQLGEDERRVLAEASLVARYGEDESPIRPEQIIEPRRREDVGQNLCMPYNTIQQNIIRGGLHGAKRNADGRLRRSQIGTAHV